MLRAYIVMVKIEIGDNVVFAVEQPSLESGHQGETPTLSNQGIMNREILKDSHKKEPEH